MAATLRTLVAGVALVAVAGACQGNWGEEPPVHIWHNMDFQNRFDAQEANDFYYDIDCLEESQAQAEAIEKAHEVGTHYRVPNPRCYARAMRKPPEGTVAVGHLKNDDHLYQGRDLSGRLVDELPPTVPLTPELLDRGEARYNIYCQPCHDYVGSGDGIVARRGGGFPAKQPANFHTPELRAMPLGYFFHVITNGQGTMMPYAAQIPVEDRWAIAVWVRTLQQSRTTLAMGGGKS
ncbi:MAG: cytochrome c [Myxococcales bacterium]|nr:cytochrome c [Myxococcales bacterium]